MRLMRVPVITVFLGVILAAHVHAAVSLHALFSDGMVLQRDRAVAIWGKAEPEEKVTVSFRGAEKSATADRAGRWQISIPSGGAGGPFHLDVKTAADTHSLQAWVGEVWMASGQSNMERRVGQDNSADDLADASAQAPEPTIRMFTVQRAMEPERPANDIRGSWLPASAETVKEFSSVAYFFARKLSRELHVPIGIIHTSWGGTYAEAWLSREALEPTPTAARFRLNYQKRLSAYEEQLAAFERLDAGAKKNATPPSAPIAPSSLYNGMIAPLAPYTLRGAIWYQGEANIGNGYEYRDLLTALIMDWRKLWHDAFPFFIVQIAPYRAVVEHPTESNSALLRESQRFVAQNVENTGLVVTSDLGHECDVHPIPKRPVGERLAALALNRAYARPVVATGPNPKRAIREGNAVRISFDGVGGGLVAREWEKSQPKRDRQNYLGYAWRAKPVLVDERAVRLLDFSLAGDDRVFRRAEARIDGETLLIASAEVSDPKFVRYGCQEHPIGNLFNREGFPASPFEVAVVR